MQITHNYYCQIMAKNFVMICKKKKRRMWNWNFLDCMNTPWKPPIEIFAYMLMYPIWACVEAWSLHIKYEHIMETLLKRFLHRCSYTQNTVVHDSRKIKQLLNLANRDFMCRREVICIEAAFSMDRACFQEAVIRSNTWQCRAKQGCR
jgi:hypothetical protein